MLQRPRQESAKIVHILADFSQHYVVSCWFRFLIVLTVFVQFLIAGFSENMSGGKWLIIKTTPYDVCFSMFRFDGLKTFSQCTLFIVWMDGLFNLVYR